MEAVKAYIEKHSDYKVALIKLRTLLLSTELEETVKWGMPTYTINNKNVVGLNAFKHRCGLWFFNGALINDTYGKLLNAQKEKTQAMRNLKFESIDDVDETIILDYVQQAIENEKAGLKVKFQKKALVIPPELAKKLTNKAFYNAFYSFSESKQKEFANYIREAKRAETKQKRLEKIIPMILHNIGLNDKYKKC